MAVLNSKFQEYGFWSHRLRILSVYTRQHWSIRSPHPIRAPSGEAKPTWPRGCILILLHLAYPLQAYKRKIYHFPNNIITFIANTDCMSHQHAQLLVVTFLMRGLEHCKGLPLVPKRTMVKTARFFARDQFRGSLRSFDGWGTRTILPTCFNPWVISSEWAACSLRITVPGTWSRLPVSRMPRKPMLIHS